MVIILFLYKQERKMQEYTLKNDIMQLLKKQDECVVTRIKGRTGDMLTTNHEVFPGINLVYNDVNFEESESVSIKNEKCSGVLEINHCREGRIECSCKNDFFYLSPGDLCIHMKSTVGDDLYFPSGNYQGISILIDIKQAPLCLSCILDDVNVRPEQLVRKFCRDGSLFVCRSNSHLEHIFSELYSIPQEVQKGYYKIKVLEILLFLSCLSTETREEKLFSSAQVSIAKEVCRYLTAHMEERITIEKLSDKFHVSQTVLKNSFKVVYGMSIYSFIRTQKMQSAAAMLRNTDKTVLEIANLHGYENGSKFASAFRDIMGVSPAEYRQNGAFN